MIRSVVDRQPSLLLCKGCPTMIKRPRGGIYHTSTLARVITCWWCCCVLLWSIFLFFPRVHQLMCCCCDDQLPLWRHTSPLNCDDRCDNGWLLMQSYQAIWWCVDGLIMRWSNIMWWRCVHDQAPPLKHKSHVSCDRSKQLLSSFFQSWFETFSRSLNSQEVLAQLPKSAITRHNRKRWRLKLRLRLRMWKDEGVCMWKVKMEVISCIGGWDYWGSEE